MSPEDQRSWERRITCWRAELKVLGRRLDRAHWDDEVAFVSTLVRDLRIRVRQACDELAIPTLDDDTLSHLIRKITKAIQ